MRSLGIIFHAGPIDDVKKRNSFDEILDADDAWAFAQFLKRVSFATCERHSANPEEARRMMNALVVVQNAVNAAGYNPR